MIPQNLLQSLLGFAHLLLRRVGFPLAAKYAVHLQGNSHHGTECHRVERGRVVVRAIVRHLNHATRANLRLQARGAQWL